MCCVGRFGRRGWLGRSRWWRWWCCLITCIACGGCVEGMLTMRRGAGISSLRFRAPCRPPSVARRGGWPSRCGASGNAAIGSDCCATSEMSTPRGLRAFQSGQAWLGGCRAGLAVLQFSSLRARRPAAGRLGPGRADCSADPAGARRSLPEGAVIWRSPPIKPSE